MSAEFLRRARSRRRLSALSALLAAIGFVSMWPPSARADQEVDQIVGGGDTASALTVQWGQGLLGADNKTVVAPRDPRSPYAFMDNDFAGLTVHVSQTAQLVHQAITISWSGGLPTQQPFKSNFLQIMQCYGDAFTGPDPEGCQFGSAGLLQAGVINAGIGSREGNTCASTAPSIADPPRTQDGSGPGNGCDPSESGDGGIFSVPFIPAGTTDRFFGTQTEFYDQFNTNEVQQANTGADGTGEQSFQILTSVQAPGLGCGLIKSDGKPRDCWLVIVPRGTYDPNGWKVNGSTDVGGYVNGSPLGAATWAKRIQIHLGFNDVPSNCAIGSAKERPLIGTELAARAVFSWQIALNSAAKCKTIFGYAATPEPVNTLQLASADGAGLAFTTIPIGSEVTRSGGTVASGPPLVYAPLAASAITFPFHINQSSGLVATHIKLTPRLMAKALTQSYRFELPDVDSNHPGPDWAKGNPNFITDDPEFRQLNPGIATPPTGLPRAPLLTEDHSAVNQQVWSWIIADPAARAWLGGTPDEHGMWSSTRTIRSCTLAWPRSTRIRAPTPPASSRRTRRNESPGVPWIACPTCTISTTPRRTFARPTIRRARTGTRPSSPRTVRRAGGATAESSRPGGFSFGASRVPPTWPTSASCRPTCAAPTARIVLLRRRPRWRPRSRPQNPTAQGFCTSTRPRPGPVGTRWSPSPMPPCGRRKARRRCATTPR